MRATVGGIEGNWGLRGAGAVVAGTGAGDPALPSISVSVTTRTSSHFTRRTTASLQDAMCSERCLSSSDETRAL